MDAVEDDGNALDGSAPASVVAATWKSYCSRADARQFNSLWDNFVLSKKMR
jgi:hypothetical protein